MARIVIAGVSETGREQLYRLLASSGLPVFRSCASISELRRTINECEDGVIILMGNLPGCKPDELRWDYGDRIRILLIAKPTVLAACESPDIFRLPLPASGQTVIGAVSMLSQMHQMQLPKRTATDKQTVDRAKEIIMKQRNLSEPEAHRILQQYAMNHGIKMTDYAAQIIRTSMRTEE